MRHFSYAPAILSAAFFPFVPKLELGNEGNTVVSSH